MTETRLYDGVDLDSYRAVVTRLTVQRDQARAIAVDLEQQFAATSPARVLRDAAAHLDEVGQRQAAQIVLGMADEKGRTDATE